MHVIILIPATARQYLRLKCRVSLQRYVSKELTHFVGRKFRDECSTAAEAEEKQYSLLTTILLSGQLGIHSGASVQRAVGGPASLSSNLLYNPQVVCFCDIPLEDLSIHRQKYSSFGLAFSKRLLVEKGATPIYYVSANSRSFLSPHVSFLQKTGRSTASWGEVFDNYHDEYEEKAGELSRLAADYKASIPQVLNAAINRLLNLQFDLWFLLFANIKFFDASKDDSD